jgi:hypothetical protein
MIANPYDRESIEEANMGSAGVYRVIIESSHSEGRYQKEYIGPAASEDDALEQARTVFKEWPDDCLVAVEVVELESWTEDVVLPPYGEDLITA